MFVRNFQSRLISTKRLLVRALLLFAGTTGYAISNGAQAAVLTLRGGPAFTATVITPTPRPGLWIAPPPPRAILMPGPRPGWIWSPGYWRWTGRAYVWIGGAWLPARPGYVYATAHWVRDAGGWIFVPGEWVRR